MPRELGDVLDYLLPDARSPSPPEPEPVRRDDLPSSHSRTRNPRPAALPIVGVPVEQRDVIRAAFIWNLAVEIARLGASATLVAPRGMGAESLWPSTERGPVGAELALVESSDLGSLNRAALDVAVSRAADSPDGGVVLVHVPTGWLEPGADARALLRWVLLFSSPDSDDLRNAFALTKRVLQTTDSTRIGVTIHGARRVGEAEHAFQRLAGTALRHLQHAPVSYGLLVDDLNVYRAIVAQRPIGLEHPQSRASRALRDVARLLLADARAPASG